MYSIIFLAISSFIICFALTPIVRIWCHRRGVLDHPGIAHRRHSSPIPRVGGVAVVLSYVAAGGLLLLSPLHGAGSVQLPLVWYLLPAIAVVFATGLLDDVKGLNPWQKLFGQAVGAVLAYYAGIHVLGIAGFSAHGWWSLPLTILWLVGCANAFNLIDGLDGLAAGVGLFATLTMFLAALLQHNTPLALATVPLAGALLAFLRYNFNPASIFLGDSGSLTIGFLLGCYSVVWSEKSATIVGLTAPLMALSIPLLDTLLSIGRRFLRHQPIFGSDRNHIHHRLLDRGFSPRKAVWVLYAVCGLAGGFSLLVTQNRFAGLIVVLFCLAVVIGVQCLGYSEFDVARRLARGGTFRHIVHTQVYMGTFEKQLAESTTKEDCWQAILEAGRAFGFGQVRMQLGGSTFEERLHSEEYPESCTMRIPLSDTDYVNISHRNGSSVKHFLAMPAFVEVLQRALAPRVQQFQSSSTMPATNVIRENARNGLKSLTEAKSISATGATKY